MLKKVFIETVGCQMNVLDSELVTSGLLEAGYTLATSRREANIILFNTCSVRQHAEDKVYSALGRLKHVKRQQPPKIVGVMGCMAQKDQELIFQRAAHVDLVVGPGQIGQIPRLLDEILADGLPRLEVSIERKGARRSDVEQSFEQHDPLRMQEARPRPHQAMLRIMFGCDNFCTYCIVPSVRGPEQSRQVAEIHEEVCRLADQGCVEVTLLGQTVSNYCDTSTGSTVRLADLLEQLHEIGGIERIKFVTNYPLTMTDDLLQSVRDLPKVSPYLHVPAQSGSNQMLQRMKRGYTIEEYREMLDRIRQIVPDAAVTSDFIVGFCGETEDDFRQTADLVRDGRFKNSFIFKYSERFGTKSAELYPDDISDEVKRRRNNELLAIQNEISQEENDPFVGRVVEILVEGPSKSSVKNPPDGPVIQLVGRTTCDRIVVFEGDRDLVGQLTSVRIDRCNSFTLFGQKL